MDVCDLGKTDIILEILWLQAHNPEINWKIEEVKMMKCPPLYRRNMKLKEEKGERTGERLTTLEKEKIVRQTVDDKKDWEREEKVEADN